MKKYNHGTSIVEILLSIIIISITLMALMGILISVRKDSESNQIQSQYVLNQSQFVQMIEDDITQYGVDLVSSCDVYEVDMDSFNINDRNRRDFKCLRLNYSADYLTDNIGYIMILNYNYKYDNTNNNLKGKESSWMIRYTRGHYDTNGNWIPLNSHMSEFPDNTSLEGNTTVKFTRSDVGSNNIDAAKISIPITSQNGERYDINLPMLLKSTQSFTCYTGASAGTTYSTVDCICEGQCDGLIKNNMYSVK